MRINTTLLIIMSIAISTVGLADRKYGMGGCGLGGLLIGNSPNGFIQAIAYTTNVSLAHQSTAILMGTSNCVPDAPETEKKTQSIYQEHFVSQNLASLAKEMAQGNGETLQAFSQSLGCEQNSYDIFSSQVKESYQRILAAPGAMAVLETTKEELRKNSKLRQSCRHLG